MDDENLVYKFMNEFDMAMNLLEEKHGWLNIAMGFAAERYHEEDKVSYRITVRLAFVSY